MLNLKCARFLLFAAALALIVAFGGSATIAADMPVARTAAATTPVKKTTPLPPARRKVIVRDDRDYRNIIRLASRSYQGYFPLFLGVAY